MKGLVQKQVIVQWYTPEERVPQNDFAVLATVSGKANGVEFKHALMIMIYDTEEGWFSMEYEFDELTVHAWCDIDPYEG